MGVEVAATATMYNQYDTWSTKKRRYKSKTSFLDLENELFYRTFSYLSFKHASRLKDVCYYLRFFSYGYVTHAIRFFMIAEKSTEIVNLYFKNTRTPVLLSKKLKKKDQFHDPEQLLAGGFAAGNGKQVVCCYLTHAFYYRYKCKSWYETPPAVQPTWYGAGCWIGPEWFVITGGCGKSKVKNRVALLKFQPDNGTTTDLEDNDSAVAPGTCIGGMECFTDLPKKLYHHSITHIVGDTVIIVGGKRIRNKTSKFVYEGRLCHNGLPGQDPKHGVPKTLPDIMWHPLPNLSRGRYWHICFKLDNLLVVAGGYCKKISRRSEVYNIAEQTWKPGPRLPYPLAMSYAVTDRYQNFAVIVGGRLNDDEMSNKVIIFTENKGFFQLKGVSVGEVTHKKRSAYHHVSSNRSEEFVPAIFPIT